MNDVSCHWQTAPPGNFCCQVHKWKGRLISDQTGNYDDSFPRFVTRKERGRIIVKGHRNSGLQTIPTDWQSRSGVVCKCYLANSKAGWAMKDFSWTSSKLQGYCGGGRMVAPSFPLLTVDSPTRMSCFIRSGGQYEEFKYRRKEIQHPLKKCWSGGLAQSELRMS